MNDLRYAWRQLLKSPGFTATALITLALGVGANTTIFSTLNAVLFRSVPFPHADRLVRLYRVSPLSNRWPHSAADFLDYQQQNEVFTHLAAFYGSGLNLTGDDRPAERISALRVTGDFFQVLAGMPSLGRTLQPADDQPGRDRVMVLSDGLWQRRFGGDTNIVGRTLRVDGETVTVVGVMPPQFQLARLWGIIDAWQPAAFTADQARNRGSHYLDAVGCLKPGVSLRQAQAHLGALAARLAQQYPQTNAGESVQVIHLTKSAANRAIWSVSYFLLATVSFVLLIACVNVANLQLARAATRQREVAVRMALGASRGRLLRQLLTESLLLGVLGGGLGLVLSTWGVDLLGRQLYLGRSAGAGLRLSLDGWMLGYTLGLSVIAGLLCGLTPAWHASRMNVQAGLKEAGRGMSMARWQHRMRAGLVVAQMALALVSLTGAGLFLRSIHGFIRVDPGFRTDHLLTLHLTLPQRKYPSSELRLGFYREAFARLGSLPGVRGVAASTSLPLFGSASSGNFVMEGRPEPPAGHMPLAHLDSVNPDFFATLGMSIQHGRGLTDADRESTPSVVVINETMARRFWAGENPVGKRLAFGDPARPQWKEIVGVVSDVRNPANFEHPVDPPHVYLALGQSTPPSLAIALRTAVPPETLTEAVRWAVGAVDPEVPAHEITSFEEAVTLEMANYRLAARLLGGFALLGLFLAATGVYGVVSYTVAQRTPELGVRLALGAQPAEVLRLVVREGLKLTFAGAGIGLVGALALASAIRGLLHGVRTFDPMTFGLVLALLAGVALCACWLPARRAARVDPVVALRTE